MMLETNCSSFIYFQKCIKKSHSFLHNHSILPVLGSLQFICCSYKRKKLCPLLNFVNICFFVILKCVLVLKAVYLLRFLSYESRVYNSIVYVATV